MSEKSKMTLHQVLSSVSVLMAAKVLHLDSPNSPTKHIQSLSIRAVEKKCHIP